MENHGKSMMKIPWIPLKTMEQEQNSMVFMGNYHVFHAGMEKENCQKIPHESMESMESKTMENHGKHGNLQK